MKLYRTIILPVVLYGCETGSVTLKEEHRLRVIFGSNGEEVTGDWRRLHNEELHEFYCLTNVIRVIKSKRIRWAGHVARMGERRGAYRVWWGNLRERDHLEGLGVDGRVMLKWPLKK
jgi:hypothetical protein